jgi:hypothetical protein
MSRRLRGLSRWATAAFVIALAGCSDDPDGPGTLDLVVRGPAPLGAAVVQITGAGVTGADTAAPGWVELVPVAPSGSTPVHRLVIVQETAGELRVRLGVSDVSAPPPQVSVLQASDRFDLPVVNPGSLEVLFGG